MTKRVLLAACVTVAIVLLLFGRQINKPDSDFSVQLNDVLAKTSIDVESRSANEASGNHNTLPETEACWSESELTNHPSILNELSRLAPFSTLNSNDIEPFRGLSEDELISFANQGDSAAMAVLGSMYVMRAQGSPDSAAVDQFLPPEESTFRRYKVPPNQEELFEKAAYWFYESALHGRLLALENLGTVLTFKRTSPVDLGWMTEKEFDDWKESEKYFSIYEVYRGLAYSIAPELESGFLQIDSTFGTGARSRYSKVIGKLQLQFNEDLTSRNLRPVLVPDSTFPPMDELRALLCESDR